MPVNCHLKMNLLNTLQQLEGTSSANRFSAVTHILTNWQVPYAVQPYATGKNIVIYPTGNLPVVGVSSHFDVVPGSPGANDNASSMAVCLGVLHRLQTHTFKNIAIAVFFFDEEEAGLLGSQAYLQQNGLQNMQSLINLEMVGQGDKFALWQLNDASAGKALEAFEEVAAQNNIYCNRFDKIVTNYADHGSFRKAGLQDAFSVTCISSDDLTVATEFYAAQQKSLPLSSLQEIISKAPLFRHYHQPSDKSAHLNENSLQMTLNAVWQTLLLLDK